MRINVGWCVFSEKPTPLDLLVITPEPVLKKYSEMANAYYRKCPSYLNHFKNTYAICSPFDVEIEINKEEKWYKFIEPKSAPHELIKPRFNEEGDSPYPIFSLLLTPIVFSPIDCKKDVYITQLEPSLEWDRARDIRLIEGSFNISKWTRPFDAGFEQKTKNIRVKFKRGQPIYYVKFSTDDPEDVIILNRVEFTESLRKESLRCIGIKNLMSNMKLKDLYELNENYKKQVKGHCSFSLHSLWRWIFPKH